MGIPKLWSDLQQFSEQVVLGKSSADDERKTVDKLVVDGPSLIYYVYHRLAAFKSSYGSSYLHQLPTYAEINEGTRRLLLDFEAHDVQIKRIFFDGGLPIYKRSTRMERLEKLRLQLLSYRKLYATGFDARRGVKIAAIEYESAFWGTNYGKSAIQSLIPPPFMIISAIEDLRASKWAYLLQIVPSEADPYCAEHARQSECAILSSDSDMAVYDLGEHGCVVTLQSLEKSCSAALIADEQELVASCTSPALIAKRLGVPSIERIAFERKLDVSATFSTVLQRARDRPRFEIMAAQYFSFALQYKLMNQSRQLEDGFPVPNLVSDPRLAELIAQILGPSHIADTLHMYLPFLFEDPTRDAAWSYGTSFRQLAYSMLASLARPESAMDKVHEFYRSGNRFTGAARDILEGQTLGRATAGVCKTLETQVSWLAESASQPLAWQLFALREVQKHRVQHGKAPLSEEQIWPQLEREDGNSGNTWDDNHLSACIQAVLYSVRVLKDVLNLVLNRNEHHQGEHRKIHAILQSLPRISELILSPDNKGAEMGRVSRSQLDAAVVQVLHFSELDKDDKDANEYSPEDENMESTRMAEFSVMQMGSGVTDAAATVKAIGRANHGADAANRRQKRKKKRR